MSFAPIGKFPSGSGDGGGGGGEGQNSSDVSKSENFILVRIRNWYRSLPPYSTASLTQYYIPLAGAVSYCAFSVNVFIPRVLSRILPVSATACNNFLLINSHLGTGAYLYHTRHLAVLPLYQRTMFSVYNSVLFNLGSVLLWAIVKSLLPQNCLVRSAFAATSSVVLLNIGTEYIDHIDSEFRSH